MTQNSSRKSSNINLFIDLRSYKFSSLKKETECIKYKIKYCLESGRKILSNKIEPKNRNYYKNLIKIDYMFIKTYNNGY